MKEDLQLLNQTLQKVFEHAKEKDDTRLLILVAIAAAALLRIAVKAEKQDKPLRRMARDISAN